MGDAMYLIDTNVISELRKRGSANPGVHTFFNEVAVKEIPCYLSVVTVGELVRGSAMIRHRGDTKQADAIDTWLKTILDDYATNILAIDQDVATVWGHLRGCEITESFFRLKVLNLGTEIGEHKAASGTITMWLNSTTPIPLRGVAHRS